MKRYTETTTIYEGMARSFFFVESANDNELNDFIRGYSEYIVLSLRQKGVNVADFTYIPTTISDRNIIKRVILRQQPFIDEETLEKRADESTACQRSRLVFINSAGYDYDGLFEADILCEDDFGSSKPEHAKRLDKFLDTIVALHTEQSRIEGTRFRLPFLGEECDELQAKDNKECLCDDLLAESICNSEEVKISPIQFDNEFNISLPLYPQVRITLEPLPKTLYILFLQHPEGIILKDICLYENELKNIYKQVSGRKNPSVIERMFRSLTDPTENPLHKNLSIIRRSFTSKLNYSIARNYIPAHGRTKAHNIPLESEYIILPEIA